MKIRVKLKCDRCRGTLRQLDTNSATLASEPGFLRYRGKKTFCYSCAVFLGLVKEEETTMELVEALKAELRKMLDDPNFGVKTLVKLERSARAGRSFLIAMSGKTGD